MPSARKAQTKEVKSSEVNIYNIHDGLHGRPRGIYLDELERRNAETVRANIEDREPDYDNPGASAGTPLVTADGLPAAGVRDGAVYPSDKEVLATPVGTVDLEAGSSEDTNIDEVLNTPVEDEDNE